MEQAAGDQVLEYLEVVFIFQDGFHALSLPDVNYRVANHASVTACCCCTERVGVINVEVAGQTLDDEPGFMSGNDGACAVKFLDIESTCLSSRRSISNLNRNEWKLIRVIGKIRMLFDK